jgi:hypothetical protein
LSVNPTTGAFIYTPNANSSGSDSFTYKVIDSYGVESNVGTVNIDFRVTAVKIGNKLVIFGTGAIDDLVISKTGNSITVTGINGTLINGNNTSVTFTGIRNIEASLLNGNDSLWVQSAINLDNLTINGGNDNDTIILGNDYRVAGHNDIRTQTFKNASYLRVAQSLVVNGGDGDDSVYERKIRVNGSKTVDLGAGNDRNDLYWSLANTNTILGGIGDDTIFLGYLSSFGVASYDTGAGNDLLGSFGCRFYENITAVSGADGDTVALDVNRYDKNVSLDTGAGSDYLLFSRSVADALVDLKTGEGYDNLLIGRWISGVNSSGSAVYSDGGSIVDRMTIDAGSEADTSEIARNQIRLLFANYGSGRDELTVRDNVILEDSIVDGGADGARLTQRNNSPKLRFRNV